MASNRPIHSIKANGVEIAIWEGDYKGEPTYSVTLQRSYKTDDGYKNTGFLRKTDLLITSRLLGQAFDYINDIRNAKTNTNDDAFNDDAF